MDKIDIVFYVYLLVAGTWFITATWHVWLGDFVEWCKDTIEGWRYNRTMKRYDIAVDRYNAAVERTANRLRSQGKDVRITYVNHVGEL